MAQETAINATLQARDWEFLMGIVDTRSSPELEDCLTRLRVYYDGLGTKPENQDNIQIATTEGVIVTLYSNMLYTATGITQSNNQQPYTRIRTAILALNNVADNYILDQITDREAYWNTQSGQRRKEGRRIIMMKTYDNN